MEIIDVDKGHRHHQWILCIGSAMEDDWRAEASEEEVMRGDARVPKLGSPGTSKFGCPTTHSLERV
jgi:hypothetical protein